MKITRDDVYELLEQKMLSYTEFEDIPVLTRDDSEDIPLEAVREQTVIRVRSLDDSMALLTKDQIFVRRPVVDMLFQAGQELKNLDRRLTLRVVYGFRAAEVQEELFEAARQSLEAEHPDPKELLEVTHRRIAVPSVAGRPTGGAVGVDILRGGEPVDMGTPTLEFTRDAFTFSPFVGREAWENRQLLRQAMMAAGFAPFDGEWWHFSYGDKEWARYYRKSHALFDQLSFREAQKVAPGDSLTM